MAIVWKILWFWILHQQIQGSCLEQDIVNCNLINIVRIARIKLVVDPGSYLVHIYIAIIWLLQC